MARHMNGWRRIALVISILWIAVASAATGLDYFNKGAGYFVYKSIPIGTVVTDSAIKLPDGKTISRQEQKEFEQRLRAEQGDSKKPWEINWSKQTGVPTASAVHWPHFLFTGLALPLLLWIFAELSAHAVRWVGHGFKESKQKSGAID